MDEASGQRPCPHVWLPEPGAKLDGDLMHTEQPTELKHITQWRKSKQLRLLQ